MAENLSQMDLTRRNKMSDKTAMAGLFLFSER